MVGAQDTHATDQAGHLRGGQAQKLCAVQQHFFGADDVVFLGPVAEAVVHRLEHRERLHIGHVLGRVTAAWVERHWDVQTSGLDGLLQAHVTGQDNHVGHAGAAVFGDAFQDLQDLGQTGGLVAFPVLLGGQTDACTVGTTAHVGATVGAGAVPSGGHHLAHAQTTGGDFGFDSRHVVTGFARGDGVLPDQVFSRHFRADVANLRTHVAVGQLEPSAGKDFGEVLGVFVEALRDLAVSGVHLHGHVGVGHHGHDFDRRIFHVSGHVFGLDVDRTPLVRTGGALGEFPLVVQQQVEVAVVPLRGVGGPSAFDAAGHGVAANTAAGVVHPTKTLLMDVSTFRGWTQVLGFAVAVRFTHGVATGGQSTGFFVVHGHAQEGQTHVLCGAQGVGLAVDAFGVHVDQTHLHSGQRVFQRLALITVVATRGQPLFFRTPVDVFFGVPDVFATKGEAVGLQAHGFVGDVAGQDHQVGPADFVAVFFLDGPDQTTGFVQVAVVGPRVQRSEALIASARTTTAVGHAVRTGCVPCHADHQTTVVAPVGRPPVLAVGHQSSQVFFDRGDVELFDFFAVVKTLERIGLAVLLVQDVQVQGIGPPSHVRVTRSGVGAVHDGATAGCAFLAVHIPIPLCWG